MSWITSSRLLLSASVLMLLFAISGIAEATSLTFEFYTDSTKTTRIANGGYSFQNYGDAVTDFDPAGASWRYGSAGGYTPDVNVEYRYYHPVNLPDNFYTGAVAYYSQPGDNFGDLAQVIYNGQIPPYYVEIRLIPLNGKTVTLESFDLAGYKTDRVMPHIEVIKDVGGTPVSVWGPLTNTTISGTTHNTFSPNVSATAGHTLSLIFGDDSNGSRGISNFVFSTPEPASLCLLGLGSALILSRRQRG